MFSYIQTVYIPFGVNAEAATLISLGTFVSSYVGNGLVIIVRNYVNSCEVNLYQ